MTWPRCQKPVFRKAGSFRGSPWFVGGKTHMADSAAALPESIECPLCLGKGELSRTEVLERLGMRDFARVAQLSAEEAIRLILKKEKDAEQTGWATVDAEMARRADEGPA